MHNMQGITALLGLPIFLLIRWAMSSNGSVASDAAPTPVPTPSSEAAPVTNVAAVVVNEVQSAAVADVIATEATSATTATEATVQDVSQPSADVDTEVSPVVSPRSTRASTAANTRATRSAGSRK